MRRSPVGAYPEGKRSWILILAVLAGLLAWPMAGDSYADIVILKNGTMLKGEIVSQTTDAVLVRFKTDTISFTKKILRKDIDRIEKETEPPKPASEPSAPAKQAKDKTFPKPPTPMKKPPAPPASPSQAKPGPSSDDDKPTDVKPQGEAADDSPTLQIDLRYGLKHTLFPKSVKDEGTDIEPRRRRRFVLVPASYDPNRSGLVVSTSTYNFYLEGNKKASRKGILLMKNNTRKGEPLDLTLDDSNPVWERVELRPPEKKKNTRRSKKAATAPPPVLGDNDANQLECSNLRSPAPRKKGRIRFGGERVRKATRPASGYLAFLLEVPEDQKTLTFRYRDGPAVTFLLDWMEQAGQPLDTVKGDEADQTLQGLSELIRSGSTPMAELAVARLAAWRKSPSPDTEVATILHMEEALLSALARGETRIRRTAWEELVYGPTDFSKSATASLLTKLTPEMLDGLLAETTNLLGNTRVETGKEGSRSRQGRTASRKLDEKTFVPSKLPVSAADANLFHALLAICRTAKDPIVERVVDALLADGTQQSVSLFASPSRARKIVSAKVKDIADGDLKAAVFATLLKNADSEDLPDLAAAAASIPLSIDSEKHPLLDLGSRAEGQAALNALLRMLSRANIAQSVLEDKKMISLLNVLVGEGADERTQQKAIEFVLAKWRPIVRLAENSSAPKKRNGGALAQFLADRLTNENEDIHIAVGKALLAAGEIDLLTHGLKRAHVEIKRRILDRIGKDPILSKEESTFRFLAVAALELKDVAAEALLLLDRLTSGLGSERWFGYQAIKRQVEWNRISALVGTSEAGKAAMKILRNVAAIDRAKRDELEVKQDREGRRRFVQEIDQNHKKNPDGLFGCAVYADLVIPIEPNEPPVVATSAKPSAPQATRWRQIFNQWFAIEGVSIKTGTDGIEVRYGAGKDKKSITPIFDDSQNPLQAGNIRINVTPLLRDAMKSERLRDASWSQIAGQVDLPPDVIVDFKYHQLGTWMAKFTFTPGGQRGQQSGDHVSLGQSTKRPKPFLANVTIVLEPIPRI